MLNNTLSFVSYQILKFTNFSNRGNKVDRVRSRRRDDEPRESRLASCTGERESREESLKLSSAVQISMDQSRSYKSWPIQCYLALPVRRTDISRTPPRNIPMWGGFLYRTEEDRAQSICCPLSTPFTSLRHLSLGRGR